MESLLTGPVSRGFVAKLCGSKRGSTKCGRLARVYSRTRARLLCDRCVNPAVDVDTEPVTQDGARFGATAPAAPVNAMAVLMAEVERVAEAAGVEVKRG